MGFEPTPSGRLRVRRSTEVSASSPPPRPCESKQASRMGRKSAPGNVRRLSLNGRSRSALPTELRAGIAAGTDGFEPPTRCNSILHHRLLCSPASRAREGDWRGTGDAVAALAGDQPCGWRGSNSLGACAPAPRSNRHLHHRLRPCGRMLVRHRGTVEAVPPLRAPHALSI